METKTRWRQENCEGKGGAQKKFGATVKRLPQLPAHDPRHGSFLVIGRWLVTHCLDLILSLEFGNLRKQNEFKIRSIPVLLGFRRAIGLN